MQTSIGNKTIPLRKVILTVLSAVGIPLLIIVILFNWFTYRSEQSTLHNAYQNTLALYAASVEQSAQAAQEFVITKSVNDADFQSVLYARNKTEAYLYSRIVSEKGHVLINNESIFSCLLIYSEPYDCWYITQDISYSQKDLQTIRDYLSQHITDQYSRSGWLPLTLSDHNVLLFYTSNRDVVMAAVLDLNVQEYSGLTANDHVFFSLSDGTALTDSPLADAVLQYSDADTERIRTFSGKSWDLTKLHIENPDCFILYAHPYSLFTEHLTLTQQILLTATIILIISLLLYWLLLRELLIKPLDRLTDTTKEIQAGRIDVRVSENDRIEEVNWIAQTVNTMLDTIRRQKVDAYEHQIKIQQAQLQYLQMQIHPHFFLNCLNLIYSFAEEKKYTALQNLTIDLSDYLRSMFRDNSRLVSLGAELHSAECYIRIQAAGKEYPPQLSLSVAPEIRDYLIPPFCILTFVENAVKHGCPASPPLIIQIKCVCLQSEEGSYLNISIIDNGGGFPDALLQVQTDESESVYRDQHVGIQNIRKRLQLLYDDKAALVLRNVSDGSCAELFIPSEKNESEGITL